MRNSAVISNCGLYRYVLRRYWDEKSIQIVFAMLNPSTADASRDDATIRRCMGFAKRWGYGGITVVNLFAFRATNPRELLQVADPVGPDNEMWWMRVMSLDSPMTVAWGANAERPQLKPVVSQFMSVARKAGARVRCLGRTKGGSPRHPLRLSYDITPERFF